MDKTIHVPQTLATEELFEYLAERVGTRNQKPEGTNPEPRAVTLTVSTPDGSAIRYRGEHWRKLDKHTSKPDKNGSVKESYLLAYSHTEILEYLEVDPGDKLELISFDWEKFK